LVAWAVPAPSPIPTIATPPDSSAPAMIFFTVRVVSMRFLSLLSGRNVTVTGCEILAFG
jgi:hypothetical protein